MRITKSTARSLLLGAAALAMGTVMLAAQGQAGTSVRPTTGQTGTGVVLSPLPGLSMAPLKCQSSGSPSEFPHALITNVSSNPIPQGKTIAYKFSSGLMGQVKLTSNLPVNGSFVTAEANEAGYHCVATIK